MKTVIGIIFRNNFITCFFTKKTLYDRETHEPLDENWWQNALILKYRTKISALPTCLARSYVEPSLS